jgi:hypothetical protein
MAFCARWNWQRCQVAPPSTALRAALMPIWETRVIVGCDDLHAAHAASDQVF